VTVKPARSNDCAMPNPIDPRPITATRCVVMDVLLRERGEGMKPLNAEDVKRRAATSAPPKKPSLLPLREKDA
jgi:hypothetical protein